MEHFFGGLALLFIGILLTFAGYQLFRAIIPIWGFIAGFSWIVDIFALGNGTGFPAPILGFVIAFLAGLLFAAGTYFFYEFAVALLATNIGYWFVAGVLMAMGFPFGLFGVLIAVVAGVAFAFAVLFYNIPKKFLAVLTAIGGATIIITGLMFMFGVVPSVILGYGMMGYIIKTSFIWTLSWIGLIIIGTVTQMQLLQKITSNSYTYPTYYSQSSLIGTKGGSVTKEEDTKELNQCKIVF